MKLQIASDIHLEFYYGTPAKVVRTINRIPRLADTLMLAGDIWIPHEGFTDIIFDAFCQRWDKVFYLGGNHDYWYLPKFDSHGDIRPSGYDIAPSAPDRLEWFSSLESKWSNLSVLRSGKVVEHEGHRFLGDTLWFPDDPLSFNHRNQMNDFFNIPNFEPWVYEQNYQFKSFLYKELRQGDIVMTHHLPSYACVSAQHKGDPLNRFYVTEMFDLIADVKPAVWIHGHNHTWEDQMLADTRVVSCPKGYPQWLIPGFDKGMVIDV